MRQTNFDDTIDDDDPGRETLPGSSLDSITLTHSKTLQNNSIQICLLPPKSMLKSGSMSRKGVGHVPASQKKTVVGVVTSLIGEARRLICCGKLEAL